MLLYLSSMQARAPGARGAASVVLKPQGVISRTYPACESKQIQPTSASFAALVKTLACYHIGLFDGPALYGRRQFGMVHLPWGPR
jgi:hypothetical protein